jgi:hypothetical protein
VVVLWHQNISKSSLPTGGFLKSPVLIQFNGIFHEINHPAIGDSPLMETPKCFYNMRGLGFVSSQKNVAINDPTLACNASSN